MNQGIPGSALEGEEADDLQRAAALIAGTMQHAGPCDPALMWAVQPSHRFSGDTVAACRTRSGRLLAMLADATGHGLPAASSLLPALQAFYTEANLDRPAGGVAREINRSLQSAGRTGRFIAAVLVEVDPEGQRVAVWNGGMPAGLWLRNQREIATRALRSQHLPLGILADTQFDATCVSFGTAAGGQLVFFSDGLIEAASPAGEAFGVLRLRRHLLAASAADAVGHVQAAVRGHLGGSDAADDISLLMISLD